eukprot:scaffold3014_cov51-Cyclotella_meneghiniana.AAC.1
MKDAWQAQGGFSATASSPRRKGPAAAIVIRDAANNPISTGREKPGNETREHVRCAISSCCEYPPRDKQGTGPKQPAPKPRKT